MLAKEQGQLYADSKGPVEYGDPQGMIDWVVE